MSFLHYLETGELLKENTFSESIYDKNKFKSVFMAGGGGSGKSFIVNLMFEGQKIPIINADIYIPYMFKKRGLPLDFDRSKPELFKKQMAARDEAKRLTEKKEIVWIKGMVPIIIDGTGKELQKIADLKNWLESIGYDTAMVFVNTSLDVAQQRARERFERDPEHGRKVDPLDTKKAWHEAQENAGKFSELFGKNFKIVDNSKNLKKGTKEYKDKELDVTKTMIKFIESPLKNKIGNAKIDQLKYENRAYLNDDEIPSKPEDSKDIKST